MLLAAPGASQAEAGLDLSWGRCGSRGDTAAALHCDQPDSVAVLNATLRVPDTLTNVAAMQVYLDLVVEADSLPGYWRLWGGECNRSGLVHSIDPDSTLCGGVANAWATLDLAVGSVYPYRRDGDAPNRCRILCTIARSSTDPITLVPGTDYFAFQLRFFADNAREAGGGCDGCPIPAAIGWSYAKIERLPDSSGKPQPEVMVFGPGARSDVAALNGPNAETLRTLRSTMAATVTTAPKAP